MKPSKRDKSLREKPAEANEVQQYSTRKELISASRCQDRQLDADKSGGMEWASFNAPNAIGWVPAPFATLLTNPSWE